MKIELKENIIPIEISGETFRIDADDVSKHVILDEYIQSYKGKRIMTEDFSNDCKRVIDTLLGDGAYAKLFCKDDLKPYYVILQIADALSDAFEDCAITDKMRMEKATTEQELQKVHDILQGMSEFNDQLNYTNKKYGAKHVVNQKRTTKKNKNGHN